MRKDLPSAITSYDFLKTLAVLLMLVDHVGYYFFEDELWLRVIGRLCVPLWFFLIGYARNHDFDRRLLIGGVILLFADYMAGHYFFPPNILFSMLAIRFMIDPLMRFCIRGPEALAFTGLILLFFGVPSEILFEYGFVGVILAMLGWLMRHRDQPAAMGEITPVMVWIFTAFTYMTFVIVQSISFEFDLLHTAALAIGTLGSFWLILNFRPEIYPGLTEKLGPVAALIRFGGRRTLEIYVGHLIFFKLLGVLTDPERFHPFTLKWFWVET